jgi:hypothetical protein
MHYFFWRSIYGEGPEAIERHSRQVFKLGAAVGFILGFIWALLFFWKG